MELWVPSFSIDTGLLLQGVNAAARPGDLQDFIVPHQLIGPSTSGDDFLIDALVGGSFELMAPSLLDTPGGFRPFVRAGLGATFGPKHDVAKKGAPGPFGLPQGSFGSIQESSIVGQGSKTSVRYLTLAPSAAAGVAFTLNYGDRTLRIKPSIEYLWQEVSLHGATTRAVALNANGNGQSLADFRLLTLATSTNEGYHAIGPGLEIELDAARSDSVMLTLYIGAQFYALLGNLQSNLSAVNSLGERADWEVDLKRWRSRASVGLRFRWLAE